MIRRLLWCPMRLQIEIANICNARCVMCPQHKMRREKDMMDFELYKDIIDQCAITERSPELIYPFLNGEPLLHPCLVEFINYAKEKSPKSEISISTNASLLNRKRTIEILDSKLDSINISFDGIDKEIYERIRVNLDFDQVCQNIIEFMEMRERRHQKRPKVNISIIKMAETEKGLEAFRSKWCKLVDSVTIEPMSNWGGAIVINQPNMKKSNKRPPCPRLWYHLVVFRDGIVPLCCNDYDGQEILGDARKNSIIDIWQGNRLNSYRAKHILGLHHEISICQNCDYPEYVELPVWWWT